MPESRAFWDKRAHKHDRKLLKGPNYAARLERAARVFAENANVLDVGCATGEITLDLAEHTGQITGIDHSPRMIEISNARTRERGVENARFEVMDVTDPTLAPRSFDVITAYSVFHLVDDLRVTLARLHELLIPSGSLITETPCLGDWNVLWRVLVKCAMLTGMAPNVLTLKTAELESLIAASGFELTESTVYNPKSGLQCILAKKRSE